MGKNFAPKVESVVEDGIKFRNEFRDKYNECFPQKRVKIRKIDKKKPWLCDDTFLSKLREKKTDCHLQT